MRNKFLTLVFLFSTIFIVTATANADTGGGVTANGDAVTANTDGGVTGSGRAFCTNKGVSSWYDWYCNCYNDYCDMTVYGLNCTRYSRYCWGAGCQSAYAWTTGCF